MMFVCCDEAIPVESQLVLALKTLSGFDVREIALRLFTTEANVYKRLGRARRRLRELPLRADVLTSDEYSRRLPAVHNILYLFAGTGWWSVTRDNTVDDTPTSQIDDGCVLSYRVRTTEYRCA